MSPPDPPPLDPPLLDPRLLDERPFDRDRRTSLHVQDVFDALWLAVRLRPARGAGSPVDGAAAAAARGQTVAGAGGDATAGDLARAAAAAAGAAAAAAAAADARRQEAARAAAARGAAAGDGSPRASDATDAAGGLYARGAGSADGEPVLRARPLRIPAGSALPNSLPLVRALRPLPSRRPSRVASELDEAATVEATARNRRVMIPVLRARPERWFEAALVIDQSPSVDIWARTIVEIERMLACAGIFRDVRTFRLEQGPIPRLRNGAHRVVPLGTLNDPAARRIVFFFSAGVSRAWNDGAIGRVLAGWGRGTPVVLLHALPPRLWPHTALGEPVALATNPTPGGPNGGLDVRRAWWARGRRLDGARFPLPVLALTPDSVARWAQMFVARRGRSAPAFLLRVEPPRGHTADRGVDAVMPPRLSARPAMTLRDRIDLFRGAAPDAFRLAVRLAVGPFTIPILHLVQESLFEQEAHHANIAEVMLSGLVMRRTPVDTPVSPDDVEFEILPEAAAVLLSSLRRDEARQMAALLRRHVEERFGCVRDQGVLWAESGGAEQLPASARPFAQLSDAFVRRLRAALPQSQPPPVTQPESEPQPQPATAAARPVNEPVVGPDDETFEPEIGSLDAAFGHPRIDRPWLTGIDILWVDDHPENNERERQTLIELGATLAHAGSTDAALQALEFRRFDIVLSDMSRAEGSEAGLDLIEALRARQHAMPVIIYASRRHILASAARAATLGVFGATSSSDELLALTLDAARVRRNAFLDRFTAHTPWLTRRDREILIGCRPSEFASHVTARVETFDRNAQQFLALLETMTGASLVHLMHVEPDVISPIASRPATLAPQVLDRLATTRPSAIARTAQTGEVHWLPDGSRSATATHDTTFATREGIRSSLILPLRDAREEVRFVVSLAFRVTDALSSTQVRWITELVRAYAVPLTQQWDLESAEFARSRSTLSFQEWRGRRARRLSQVCRIEHRDGTVLGAGFLVGPDLVMTSYDVLQRSRRWSPPPWSSKGTTVVFDGVYALPGQDAPAGFRSELTRERTVVDSHSHVANMPSLSSLEARTSRGRDVSERPVGYAILRLGNEPGNAGLVALTASGTIENVTTRGWIQLSRHPPGVEADMPLTMVLPTDDRTTGTRTFVVDVRYHASPARHDPRLSPLGLAHQVSYRVGADLTNYSGAPCFSPDWELVAMYQDTHEGRSVATDMSAIVAHLWRRERFDIIRNDPKI